MLLKSGMRVFILLFCDGMVIKGVVLFALSLAKINLRSVING